MFHQCSERLLADTDGSERAGCHGVIGGANGYLEVDELAVNVSVDEPVEYQLEWSDVVRRCGREHVLLMSHIFWHESRIESVLASNTDTARRISSDSCHHILVVDSVRAYGRNLH